VPRHGLVMIICALQLRQRQHRTTRCLPDHSVHTSLWWDLNLGPFHEITEFIVRMTHRNDPSAL
jgi:hypothetical protein